MPAAATARLFAAKPISRDEALQIARMDALRVYRDLSGYDVRTSLEDDGWHVDYELASSEFQGGGPHYVIDAFSGRLLAKRYEQ
jgi:hypothetical protein